MQYMHLCCLVISLQRLVHLSSPFIYNLIVHSYQQHCFVNGCSPFVLPGGVSVLCYWPNSCCYILVLHAINLLAHPFAPVCFPTTQVIVCSDADEVEIQFLIFRVFP